MPDDSRKTSTSALLTTTVFDCVDHNKLLKILKEMGIPDHLTCLLRNLHAGQEGTVRNERGTTDWFQIGKGVRQGCILSSCLFNLYAEYIPSLEGMMLKLKLQYFGHRMRRVDSLEKTLMLREIGGRRRRGQQRTRCLMASLTRWM